MNKQSQFTRILGATVSIALTLIFALTITAQKSTSVASPTDKSNSRPISFGETVENQIKGGETHIFQFKVKGGQYVRTEVEHKNIDVVVSLFDADEKLIVEMDSKDGMLWREAVSCLAEKDGAYRVAIKAYGTATVMGSYTVKLAEMRLAKPNDRKRLEAEAYLSLGRKFYSQQEWIKIPEAVKQYESAVALWRELGEDEWEAITLTNLGWTYSRLSKNEQAISIYTRARELFQKTKDRLGESKAVYWLGIIYSRLNQYDKAASSYEQALTIQREIKERPIIIGQTLHDLGLVYTTLRQYEKAQSYYEQALTIRREIKDRLGEGWTINNLGIIYQRLEQYEKARDFYEKALPIFREISFRNGESRVLYNLANIYGNLNQLEKARSFFEQILTIAQENGDRYEEADVYVNRGKFEWNWYQYEKAHDFFEKALIIYREMKYRQREGGTLTDAGNNYWSWKQFEKAVEYYEKALVISQELKDRRIEYDALFGLGGVYTEGNQYWKATQYYEQYLATDSDIVYGHRTNILLRLGKVYRILNEYEKAANCYEQALAISHQKKNRLVENDALMGLGALYSSIGNYKKAQDYYEQALRISRENFSINKEATFQNSGEASYQLNRYENALDYYEQQLSSARKSNTRQFEGWALMKSGIVYSKLNQNQKALQYFEQALIVFREIKNLNEEANTLINVGELYENSGQYEKAREIYEQLLAITRNAKYIIGEVKTLIRLGKTHENLGQYGKAGAYFEQAMTLAQENKDLSLEGEACWNLLELWEKQNNSQFAVFYGKQAVNAYQKIRSNIKTFDKESQQSFLKSKEPVYRRLSDILISEGRLLEAQAVLDLLKEEEFSGLLRRNSGGAESIPYSKAEDAALKILDKLAALGREKGELAKKNENNSLTETERQRFKDLQKEIEIAEAEFDKSLKALSAETNNGQNFDVVVKDAQAFMEDLRQLGNGTVAFYTVIVNAAKPSNQSNNKTKEQIKTGWIILVTPEFRKAYPIDVKNLEQTVFRFRAALSSPRYDPQPLAQEIYKKLFLQTSKKQKTTLAADLDEYFKGKPDKTLMWSLDGVLRYVPMAALHDGKTYLVEKYRNTVFNTASKARLKDAPKANWTALGLGVSVGREESGKTFPSLIGAKRELLTIVRQKDTKENQGIMPGTIKLDDQFTSEAMYDGLLFDKNPVVHIASHFSFQPADFDQSFLLLGKGKLTVKELSAKSTLFSDVDLLTLSACETAVGGANGKDVEGFAYLAQSLGAKAVMATLWQVDDIGTQILMPEFYRLHEKRIIKAEALRQAQLALLQGKIKDVPNDLNRAEIVGATENNQYNLTLYNKEGKPPFAHPFYWSPFILIGNWG